MAILGETASSRGWGGLVTVPSCCSSSVLDLLSLCSRRSGMSAWPPLSWLSMLSAWAYVLGFLGLFFLSVRWLGSWRRVQATRVAMSRYSPALQFPLQQGVTPSVPSRSPGESDDRNKVPSPTKAA